MGRAGKSSKRLGGEPKRGCRPSEGRVGECGLLLQSTEKVVRRGQLAPYLGKKQCAVITLADHEPVHSRPYPIKQISFAHKRLWPHMAEDRDGNRRLRDLFRAHRFETMILHRCFVRIGNDVGDKGCERRQASNAAPQLAAKLDGHEGGALCAQCRRKARYVDLRWPTFSSDMAECGIGGVDENRSVRIGELRG